MKNQSIESKIEGSFISRAVNELFENSLHFPLANLILEMLQENLKEYLLSPDGYILLLAAIGQALATIKLTDKNSKLRSLGNFIGPIIYFAIEAPLEGAAFFQASQHIAFAVFASLMFIFQFASSFKNTVVNHTFLIIENVVRSLIPLLLYILFESKEKSTIEILPSFFAEVPHLFISISLILIGMLLGFSKIKRNYDHNKIQTLAHQLKKYSRWSLGKKLLDEAVDNEKIFEIKRVDRTILFFDIRGFTSWSEKHSPEEVVAMLNEFYKVSETILEKYSPLKSKYTADEIMIVFKSADEAVCAALDLKVILNTHLAPLNLTVGGGLYLGPVVQGLIGGNEHKIFDVIGDSVNTAKRFCEAAKGNEILISDALIKQTNQRASYSEFRSVTLKGKAELQNVYLLSGYNKS